MFRKFPERFFRKISGTIFQNIPEISGTFRNSVTIRNSGTTFRKFPVYGKKIVPEIVPEFRISGTFSIMEMEKISGSFPYVNRNPEFRWKPYLHCLQIRYVYFMLLFYCLNICLFFTPIYQRILIQVQILSFVFYNPNFCQFSKENKSCFFFSFKI